MREEPFTQTMPIRVMRFLATSSIGLHPQVGTVAGLIAGALDSFVVDMLARGKSPKYFIESLRRFRKVEKPNG